MDRIHIGLNGVYGRLEPLCGVASHLCRGIDDVDIIELPLCSACLRALKPQLMNRLIQAPTHLGAAVKEWAYAMPRLDA